MQAVVLGWRIYELMRDPLYLGQIGLAEAVPAIGVTLMGLWLSRTNECAPADRYCPRSPVSGCAFSFLESVATFTSRCSRWLLPACLTVSAWLFARIELRHEM